MTLTKYTDEQLLAELVRRNPPQPSPRNFQRQFTVMVGIGKDHSVDIQFDPEDLGALYNHGMGNLTRAALGDKL